MIKVITDNRGYRVHKVIGSPPEIHERYGLWICQRFGKGWTKPVAVKKPRVFEHYNISHLIGGDGFYWTPDGTYQELKPGQAIVMAPGIVHNYGGRHDKYVEDFVAFTGPVADRLFASGILVPGVYDLGENRRLLPILEHLRDPSTPAQLEANFALQSLLMEIYRRKEQKTNAKGFVIQGLIQEFLRSPSKWWTIEDMAQYCNLKPSRFREVFTQYSGMSPKRYLDRLKMEEASQMLKDPEITIATIAERLGYLDPFHFSRRFKAVIGTSPKKYRELNQ